MNRQDAGTNYFTYSINPGFHMDSPGGALSVSDLIRQMEEEPAQDSYFKNETEIRNLESELIRKTKTLEGEEPIAIYFYFVPSFNDSCGSFTLCALTKVDNNGRVNFFAPQREYLSLYQPENPTEQPTLFYREVCEIKEWKQP